MKVKDVLLEQKKELSLRLQSQYIPRSVEIKNPDSNLIKIIIGPRRAGKSFFVMRYLLDTVPFGYVNFDDEQLTDPEKIPDILTAINDIYAGSRTILMDEIQNISGWELLVNRLARQGYNLFITGSNAHLLSKELATHLTGRHSVTTIFPFSFQEFLQMKNKDLTEAEYRESLEEYSLTGGFPEPLLAFIDKKDYLIRLFDAIIYKDIIRRYNIGYPQGLGDLAHYLCSTISNEYSVHSLTKISGCKSDKTVKKYLDYLEQTFLFFSVPRFSFKFKEQVSSHKKIYCIDNGFITAKGFSSSRNSGRLLENIVAVSLKKDEISGLINFYYWKNAQQEEIDGGGGGGGGGGGLVQVCTKMDDTNTKEREVRALLKGAHDLKCSNLVMLTMYEEGEQQEEWFGYSGVIRYIPLWKWLLLPAHEKLGYSLSS